MSDSAPTGLFRRISRLSAWPLHRIRWKIVLPYAFLTVLLAAGGAYLSTQLITDSLEERFYNQLAEAGRVAADSVVRTEREHLETVRAVAFTEGVPEAARASDRAKLDSLVKPIVSNGAVERLEILDSAGQRLKTFSLSDNDSLAYDEINDEYDPGRWPLVQKVLAGEVDALGDKYAQIVQTADGFVFYTAGPIVAGDDLAGVVLVGTMLDSFVTITQAEALADVTVYDFDGNPLATTFAQPGGASSNEASLDIAGEILDATLTADSSVREQRALWGRGYELGYGTLQIRDQAVGLYSVGLPSDFIFAAGSTTRTQIALLFGLGMVSVLGIGFFLAHRLTKPLLQLVRTARLVASGDLTARSGVTSADEIGTLASSFDEMTGKLQSQHLATIRALTGAIDARDPHTMGHSMRVGQLAIMIGRHLGLDEKTLSHVEIGGYLHDIGKIGIRDAVLLKPDRLTPEERLIIEEHPRIGLAILAPVDLAKEVLEFVESHHERLNGSGYPHGLRDDLVSIVARVAAVSDVYDAVTSERPYRDPMAPEEGLALLRADAGSLFDPRVVEAFAIVQPEWERRRASEPELQGFKLPDLDKTKVTV